MTPIRFKFLLPDGTPLANAMFEIHLSKSGFENGEAGILMPRSLEVMTDAQGEALVSLWPTDKMYYVVMEDPVSSAVLHYKFLVRDLEVSEAEVALQDIVVNSCMSNTSYDEAALLLIQEAKLNAMTAARQAMDAVAEMDGINDAAFDARDEVVAAKDLAKDWATKPTTEVVAGEGFSSKQYALNSSDSANQSAASATLASRWATDLDSEITPGKRSAQYYANTASSVAANATLLLNQAMAVGSGWSPVFAFEMRGQDQIIKIVNWVGGINGKPTVGLYIGSAGLVADPASAVNVRGLQGIQGIQGIQGVKGNIGDLPVVYSNTEPATGDVLWVSPGDVSDIPPGPQGIQGVKGDKGDPFVYADFTPAQLAALVGATGATGAKGQDGTGVNILGSFSNESELPASGNAGDTYLVNGDMYVWSQNSSDWVNVGSIQGPQGIQGAVGPTGPKGDKGDQGDVINGTTNLGIASRTTTTMQMTSSTGSAATIPGVSTTQAGLMASADKTKLDGIAVGATANATDAQLRDRTSHTGTTPISGGGTGSTTLANAQATLGNLTAVTDVGTLNGTEDLPVYKGGFFKTSVQKIFDWFLTKANTWTGAQIFRGNTFVEGEAGMELDFGIRGYSTGPVMHGYLANGSKAAPTALGAGQLIFGIGARGYTGTKWSDHSTAAIHMVSNEAHSDSAQGTDFRILVTPKGTTQKNRKEAVRFMCDSLNTGVRIQMRLSGTADNRTSFQTDEANANTSLTVVPNGSGYASNIQCLTSSAGNVGSRIYMEAVSGSTSHNITSNALGDGTIYPIYMNVGAFTNAKLTTTGTVEFDQGVKIGAAGPTIMQKLITATAPASAGSSTIAHGLNRANIIGVEIVANSPAGYHIKPDYMTNMSLNYYAYVDSAFCVVGMGAGKGVSIAGCPVYFLISYIP